MTALLSSLAIAAVFLPFKDDPDPAKSGEVHVKLSNGDEYASAGLVQRDEDGVVVTRVELRIPVSDTQPASLADGPVVDESAAAMFAAIGVTVPATQAPKVLAPEAAPTAPAAPAAPAGAPEDVPAKEVGASEPGFTDKPVIAVDAEPPRTAEAAQPHVDRLHALLDVAKSKLASADHWVVTELQTILAHLGLHHS